MQKWVAVGGPGCVRARVCVCVCVSHGSLLKPELLVSVRGGVTGLVEGG